MLTVGNQIKVKAIDMDFNGRGIYKEDNSIIFIDDLLKDEEALIKIYKVQKNVGFASVIERYTKSVDRSNIVSNLGSVDLVHLESEKQLEWQNNITKNTLTKVLKQEVNINKTITDSNYFKYRNKLVYHVLEEPVLKLGLYLKKPIKLVEVNEFLLSPTEIDEIVKALNQAEIQIDFEKFKHIIFRKNHINEILVTIVSKHKKFKGLNPILDVLKRFSNVIGITLNIKKKDHLILSDESYVLYGDNELIEHIGNSKLLLNDCSFFQTNTGVTKLAYDLIKKHIPSNVKVVDAYSGVGSIGFYVYDKTSKVTMLEINPDNVEMTNKTKELYGYDNTEVYLGNVTEHLDKLDGNTLIVDPPKSGLDNEFLLKSIEANFNKIIYLSCDLNTLTRDLNIYKEYYDIEVVYPIRMFPQTTSIETLVILNKK